MVWVLFSMINFHTANLRPTKSLGVREPRVWLSETKRKTPECSGVSFFRAGNSNSLTNAFHICVYVHLCVVPRYIASQHPWKQSQSLLQNTKETTAGHFRRSVFLLSGRIPGVHELLWISVMFLDGGRDTRRWMWSLSVSPEISSPP